MKKVVSSFIFLMIFLLSEGADQSPDSDSMVVQTSQGLVKGYKEKEGFYAFYGIPYATVPTGIDRYQAPLPAPTWSNVFEATDNRTICIQYDTHEGTIQKEDCLNVNVFVPESKQNNLDVVIHVHGGAFQWSYGLHVAPREIINSGNFIQVSFNYRLSVHGFLCLGTKAVPGNAGMKDMLALLKWVQENISQFGGNPNSITMSGGSSGATSVNLLGIAKPSRDLFHRMIMESSSAYSHWSVAMDPVKHAKLFAESRNFTSNDLQELESYYLTVPIEDLHSKYIEEVYFTPCIESDVGQEIFLTENPMITLQNNEIAHKPIIFDVAEKEGLWSLHTFDRTISTLNNNFEEILPTNLAFPNDSERDAVAKAVKEFYFKEDVITENSMEDFINFIGDRNFIYPVLRGVKLHVEAGNNQVYLSRYYFSDNTTVDKNTGLIGAGHTSHSRLIAAVQYKTELLSDEAKRVQDISRQLWINFIHTGNPLPEPNPILPEGWPTSTEDAFPYMAFYAEPVLRRSSFGEEFDLWNGIFDTFYKEPIPPHASPFWELSG